MQKYISQLVKTNKNNDQQKSNEKKVCCNEIFIKLIYSGGIFITFIVLIWIISIFEEEKT